MLMVRYQYAKDEQGNIVHYLEAKKGVTYYCLECGGEIIKCKGDVLEYFRHKYMSDSEVQKTHNYDNYLHNLAEQYIANKCREGHLTVRIDKTTTCLGCLFNEGNPPTCENKSSIEFNIMDKCEFMGTEKRVESNGCNYVADILLKTKNEGKPVLIEIWVTHKCTDRKMNDCKVFEVKIEKEEDLVSAVPVMNIYTTIPARDKLVKVDCLATMCRQYYDEIKDKVSIRKWKRDLMSVRMGYPNAGHLNQVCLQCDMSYITCDEHINCIRKDWDCPVKRLRFSPYYPNPSQYNLI